MAKPSFRWESQIVGDLDRGHHRIALETARIQVQRLKGSGGSAPLPHRDEETNRQHSAELNAALRWIQVLAPVWWEPLTHGSLCLRRSNENDAAFFLRCHEDIAFKQRFGRRAWWRGDLTTALMRYARTSPREHGLMYWTIEHDHQAVGLASLSQIDLSHRRAEFSIGIPGKPAAGLAHRASLMAMYFAFFNIQLHKLYTYVYEDNPEAAQATLRLGFHQEGFLKDQFRFEQNYASVWLFGLTKGQLIEHPMLVKAIKRRLRWPLPERM